MGRVLREARFGILEIEGEPTGIAVLEGNTDYLLIYSIAVKPDAQRKGYGRALLDFADQRAIEFGFHEVRLYTNEQMERNLTLYRRHGFVQVGKRPHPSRPGQVLVNMVRKLPSPDTALGACPPLLLDLRYRDKAGSGRRQQLPHRLLDACRFASAAR